MTLRYSIYNPTITTQQIIDTVEGPLNFVSDTSMAAFDGRYWAICDGSATGYWEGESDQQVWMATSDDGESWTTPFQPFRDSDYCTNPVVSAYQEWQPNVFATDTELWALWTGQYGYCSKISSADGLWTTYRFEFIEQKPYLSTTISGAAAGGRALYPTIDGISDWLPYSAGDPVRLRSTGLIVCPYTFYSIASGASLGFTNCIKYNALLTTRDGEDWSMTLIPTTKAANAAWEPFVVENAVGHIYVYSRNLTVASSTGNQDAMLVAVSYDGGQNFTPSVSSRVYTNTSRGAAVNVSGRNLMLLSDAATRYNNAIFIDGRNSDGFVPGVNFSEFNHGLKYPQGIVVDDELWINYSSGQSGNAADNNEMGRSSYQLTKVSLPDPDTALVCPRSNVMWDSYTKTSFSDPDLVADSPPYYKFTGNKRMASTTEFSTSAGASFAGWIFVPYDVTFGPLMDFRSGITGGGPLFRVAGASLASVQIFNSMTLPNTRPVFVATTITDTGTIKHYMAAGENDFSTKTSYYKSVLFSGQPTNGQTITVNSVVYTFKTTAAVTNDVQIGASTAATVANLKTAINTTSATGNAASTYLLDTRLLISLPQGGSFSVSTTSGNITVETSLDLDGSVGYVGSPRPGSSLLPFFGNVYLMKAWSSALTDNNIRYLYNDFCDNFGYDAIAGTATAPAAALLTLDPANPDTNEWATVGEAHRCEVVDENTLTIHGEASAAVELPYGTTQVGLRWRLSDTPADTDKFVIATFGLPDNPVRLYLDADDPDGLYLDGDLVMTIQQPTEWTSLSVVTSPGKVKVGNVEKYVPGAARCLLGNAYPEGLLASTKSIDFDISSMTASG